MRPAPRRRAQRRAAAALAVALTLPAAAADSAAAASRTARLCVDRATLRDTPGGFAVGYVYRPAKLKVLRTDAKDRWSHVQLKTRRRGWIRSAALCPRDG